MLELHKKHHGARMEQDTELYERQIKIVDAQIGRDAIAKAVRINHLPPEDSDISETEWLQAAASNPAFDSLKDLEEDIYTLSDGRPFHDDK